LLCYDNHREAAGSENQPKEEGGRDGARIEGGDNDVVERESEGKVENVGGFADEIVDWYDAEYSLS
jgi:hypothetical protein